MNTKVDSHSLKASRFKGNLIAYLVVGLIGAVVLLPLLNLVLISFNQEKALIYNPLSIPKSLGFENYAIAWVRSKYSMYGKNTVIVCLIAVSLNLICSSMAAYAIDRFRAKLIKNSYYYFMVGVFVPIQVIILPLFKIFKMTRLMNTLIGLAIIYTATSLPLAIMLFTGFMKSIPKELDEAASIDGCSPFGIYLKIILPVSKTIITTIAIFVSLEVWRDFFIPLVIVTEPKQKTLTAGLLNFSTEFTVEWTKFSAAMILQALPIVILFVCLQKYFTEGIVSGAVKG